MTKPISFPNFFSPIEGSPAQSLPHLKYHEFTSERKSKKSSFAGIFPWVVAQLVGARSGVLHYPGDPECHGFFCTGQPLSEEKESTGAPDQPGAWINQRPTAVPPQHAGRNWAPPPVSSFSYVDICFFQLHLLKRPSFPYAWSWLPCWRSFDHYTRVYFGACFSFLLVHFSVLMPLLHCFGYCNFVIYFEIRKCEIPALFFLKIVTIQSHINLIV